MVERRGYPGFARNQKMVLVWDGVRSRYQERTEHLGAPARLSRRHFIAGAGAVTLGMAGLYRFLSGGGAARRPVFIGEGGVLIPDPDGIIDLPEGFTYGVISRVGEPMSDGLVVPGSPDGMAAFPGVDGRTILVRNHEMGLEAPNRSPFGVGNELLGRLDQDRLYDRGSDGSPALGSTSTLTYNHVTGEVEDERLSLAGTLINCAGGPTPWNTWISCEETTPRAGDGLERDHGYNFEVPADSSVAPVRPVPLVEMGRFTHEAVAIHPQSGAVYQTEDRFDSLFYRYLPNRPGDLAAGGRLQALAVRDDTSLDTRNWDSLGYALGRVSEVEWIDLDDIDSPEDDLRLRGFDRGAARFARGEGMWFGTGAIYFACANGGSERKGQIWKYTPSPAEGAEAEAERPGRIELFVEPNDGSLIENADNLTVAPWGDLVVCEDGPGGNNLVGITPEGRIYLLAHNARSPSELAGATFSPDGSTLFVNIQGDGLTLAVQGPWGSQRRS